MDTMRGMAWSGFFRKHREEALEDSSLREVLEAGMNAFAKLGKKPMHFVVVRDPQLLEALPLAHPSAHLVTKATAAIVVCSSQRVARDSPEPWFQECAAATENILLAAHALGLGAFWLDCHDVEHHEEEIRTLLGIPRDVMPVAIVALGPPSKRNYQATPFFPERVHLERW